MEWHHPNYPFSRRLFSDELEHLCWLSTRPGRKGIESAVTALGITPEEFHGELRAGGLLGADPPAAGGLKRVELERLVLLPRGHMA